jgi:hypothetical protein
MKTKRLEILKRLKKGELTIEQADKELLVLYNVSSSTRDEIFTQAVKDSFDEPVIKHFRDYNEDCRCNDRDSPTIGGFSDW